MENREKQRRVEEILKKLPPPEETIKKIGVVAYCIQLSEWAIAPFLLNNIPEWEIRFSVWEYLCNKLEKN